MLASLLARKMGLSPKIGVFTTKLPLTLLLHFLIHLLIISTVVSAGKSNGKSVTGLSCDFESPCEWTWDTPIRNGQPGFQITSGSKVSQTLASQSEHEHFTYSGPTKDARNNTEGHFLLLAFESRNENKSAVYHVRSPWYLQSEESCYLELMIHMHNMEEGSFKMLLNTRNHTTWGSMSQLGNKLNMWEKLRPNIKKIRQPFQLILEVIPSTKIPSHLALDDIRLVNCFKSPPPNGSCSKGQFTCSNKACIDRNKLCDFTNDCVYGEDEKLKICDAMPENTTCTFESGPCGWTDISNGSISWRRTNEKSALEITGPDSDHTFLNNRSVHGYYMYVDMGAKNAQILDKTILRSSIFAHPPFYHQNKNSPFFNSCQLRFAYHMFGPHVGSLHVEILELDPSAPKRAVTFWRESGDKGNKWHRAARPLPKIDHRYAGDIGLDDISLSPECVGLGVPSIELKGGYNYDEILRQPPIDQIQTLLSNITRFEFTTCANSGRTGPTQEQCDDEYRNGILNNSVDVKMDEPMKGTQIWTVPETKHYTLIARGASGGRGALINQMTSHGSIVKATVFLRQGEKIYILIGQEGTSVCEQVSWIFLQNENVTIPPMIKEVCGRVNSNSTKPEGQSGDKGKSARAPKRVSPITELMIMNNLQGGGGGGGGATFIFKMDGGVPVLLVVAGGGGGLAYNSSALYLPYGRGLNMSLEPQSGSTQPMGAGGGGGWKGDVVQVNITYDEKILFGRKKDKDNQTMWISAGLSVLDGNGVGGIPCIDSVQWGSPGGFGGGGGGCTAGGGGGGYIGGNANVGVSANGEGGYSYIIRGALYPTATAARHNGQGSATVIPAFKGCGCDHLCVLVDDFRLNSNCVCPENSLLDEDGTSCIDREISLPLPYLIAVIVLGLIVLMFLMLLCICLYNRYQRQKVALLRRKMLGPELQLSRLRAGSGGVLTEYNPNYEFGGETYNLTDLKEIPRENLRLIKALGQGAFGEVYQGLYKHRAGDTVEMPVAVKTLPELSSNQAEMDFLMEALIMSKFNHPNIVHFIGVCFDKHPRFIILELLAGGDLKTFLRESRSKPDKPSPLTMKDLLLAALDVSKGCKYLEENHFIHRDIAARNCLLTTKGPGRVVKIADFGMARDIYRADYYKKGGKAMLPVKWMPPEAFLDGIFTSKTDVWSYGVLLWEVLSLGYMPYPGRGNQDVMQLVTNGGRLESPTNCPAPVYGIMMQCWHPMPEERPNFTTILERIGYCMQDPEVVNSPLPVFQRPPSSERDQTLMRPPSNSDDSCLRLVHGHRFSNATTMSLGTEPTSPNSSTADYLVPLTPYSYSSVSAGGFVGTTTRHDPSHGHGPSPRQSSTSSAIVPSSSSQFPESQSSETLIEDDDDSHDQETVITQPSKKNSSNKNSNYYRSNLPQASSSRVVENNNRKRNGLENGLTLNPSNLSEDKNYKKSPYSSVTVGGTGSGGGLKKSDKNPSDNEEIRC